MATKTKKYVRVHCEILAINGIACHETGCPAAWRDQVRECRSCGCEFKPETKDQYFCGDDCIADFYGLPRPEDILRPPALLGFRAAGCRRTYWLPADVCYSLAVKAEAEAGKRAKRIAKQIMRGTK